MITLYGVTSEGTSIPIEVTDQGKLVVDTSELTGYVKQGDDVNFGTIDATGKLTGSNATFGGLLDANGLTASPMGEGVISTRSAGGIRPVWRAGDGTFIKEDGTTYTSQITASGNASFVGKVFSAPTTDSDPDNTLVTKGFISSGPSGGSLSYPGYLYSTGAVGAGSEYFSVSKTGTGRYAISPIFALPNAQYTLLAIPINATGGLSAQITAQTQFTITVRVYDSSGSQTDSDISFALILPPATYRVNTDNNNESQE